MPDSLKHESEKLVHSWMRHEADWLRDYLIAGVEDPRLNLQSILSRHFLVRALTGNTFGALMREECRFSALMNWLAALLAANNGDAEALQAVHYTLRRGGDNAEGIEIPHFVLQAFAGLPAKVGQLKLPNYIDDFLAAHAAATDEASQCEPGWRTFQESWRAALQPLLPRAVPLSVLEPACGSANDYRFLQAYGLVPFLDYTGFDLCAKNVANAQALFPDARFRTGNVFEIDAPDQSFDLCFVHDLFEHLSLAGMEAAVREVCRVTRHGLSVGFFQMDEVPSHWVRPVEEYHWNLLSMQRMKDLFAAQGFEAQIIHIGTFLRHQYGCAQTHNPHAYTFYLQRKARPRIVLP